MHHFSKHFFEQIKLRNISFEEVEEALNNPDSISTEDDLTVYQKKLLANNRAYLLRIFVNEIKQPPVVVTGYKTSKINKYLQS
jgi:hypothetical protein